jgi:hypothetical protein
MKTATTKPRLRYFRNLWYCEDDFSTGRARTPMGAYLDWAQVKMREAMRRMDTAAYTAIRDASALAFRQAVQQRVKLADRMET